MKKILRGKTLVAALALAMATCLVGATSQPPDSEYNAVLKQIGTVDTVIVGESLEIRHSIDVGLGEPKQSKILSDHPADDTEVRLTVDDTGDSWVVWTREAETSHVLLRKRSTAGAWTTDFLVSAQDEHSYSPELLHDGKSIWVTYTIDDGESWGVAVRSGDGPVPWPLRSIIQTIYTRELEPEPRLHIIDNDLVVSWSESHFVLGYSTYNRETGLWDPPSFKDHGGDREEALDDIATGTN